MRHLPAKTIFESILRSTRAASALACLAIVTPQAIAEPLSVENPLYWHFDVSREGRAPEVLDLGRAALDLKAIESGKADVAGYGFIVDGVEAIAFQDDDDPFGEPVAPATPPTEEKKEGETKEGEKKEGEEP